jgi:hypothetical protein
MRRFLIFAYLEQAGLALFLAARGAYLKRMKKRTSERQD